MKADANRGLVSVVGAEGFIGRNLADALDDAGANCLRFTRSRPVVRDYALHPGAGRSDVIFYLATTINPLIAARNPERAAADLRAFECFMDLMSCSRTRPVVVLGVSAGTVYDVLADPPYTETSPTRPTNSYGRAKLQLEEELAGQARAVLPVILRLTNVYGVNNAGRAGYGVISAWTDCALAGEPLPFIGRADDTRDYVYVDDVVRAMSAVYRQADRLRATVRPGDSVILNIGAGAGTTLAELHAAFEEVTGRPHALLRQGSRTFDRAWVWVSVRRAREVLGWRPQVSLREGLLATWRARAGSPADRFAVAEKTSGRTVVR